MISGDYDVFVTEDMNMMLFMINEASGESISIIEKDGTVHGFIRTHTKTGNVDNNTGKIEMWMAHEPTGVTLDNMSEALCFVQGYFACMFKNRSQESIISY